MLASIFYCSPLLARGSFFFFLLLLLLADSSSSWLPHLSFLERFRSLVAASRTSKVPRVSPRPRAPISAKAPRSALIHGIWRRSKGRYEEQRESVGKLRVCFPSASSTYIFVDLFSFINLHWIIKRWSNFHWTWWNLIRPERIYIIILRRISNVIVVKLKRSESFALAETKREGAIIQVCCRGAEI